MILKDSVIYLIGEIVAKIFPFLLLPYLSRKLGVKIENSIAIEDSKPGALGASRSGATLILQTNEITKYMDFSEVQYAYKDVDLLETIKNVVEDK